MKLAVAGVLAYALVGTASGHGAVMFPPPRNSIDWENRAAQANQTYPVKGIACPGPDGTNTTPKNGQSCYWFSNGCGIGCDACDGNSRGPIPSSSDPSMARKMPVCSKPATPTICDKSLRTVNTDASCGGDDDWYMYSPWRFPGSAPVFDSCGMAGGRVPDHGGFGATYVTTEHATQGDRGSRTLPRYDTSTVWTAGSTVEVSWTILANHGGGYQYRLCPADQPLTEDCFFQRPLAFVGQQTLRWDAKDGKGGERFDFDGTYVSTGTMPAGSMWAKNPIPRNDTHSTFASFPPVCDEVPNCGSYAFESRCKCSGMWGPYNLEIVDTVQIPHDLPAGEWVLGWRWDCEESNQIWQSCSDVTITAAADDDGFELFGHRFTRRTVSAAAFCLFAAALLTWAWDRCMRIVARRPTTPVPMFAHAPPATVVAIAVRPATGKSV